MKLACLLGASGLMLLAFLGVVSAQPTAPKKQPKQESDTVTVMLPGTPTTPPGTEHWVRVEDDPSPVSISDTKKPASPASASLEEEIASVHEQILSAEREDAMYSGGLVKSLIAARIAILRQTEAMLRQRSMAERTGVAPKYIIDAAAASLLHGLEREVADNLDQIARQETETARYSGGLVRAMSLSTLATMRQTQAILNQRRLALKYGLKQTVFAPQPSPPPAESRSGQRAEIIPPPDQRNWRIVSIDARVTEANTTWSRYAWKLMLGNDSDKPQLFRGTIEFQDSEGFIVDTGDTGTMVVPAQSEQVFTGFTLIRAEAAGKVSRTVAKVGASR
jgi:hypothetical protein